MSVERILVVEDGADLREFLAQVLQGAEGYAVAVARDGAEGLAAATANPPDLIITDQAMPHMSGLEMVEALRQDGQRIPVILMTAEGSEELAAQAIRLGVVDYFIKPFDTEELLAAVRRVLGASRTGAMPAGLPDQNRLQALNTLLAVGKSVTSLLDIEQVATRVVEAAVYLTRAQEGSLMLLDPQTGTLQLRAICRPPQGGVSMREPVSDSRAHYVVRTGKPLLAGGSSPHGSETEYPDNSLLYVPLRVEERIIGVLAILNRAGQGPISQESGAIVAALAEYAAIAVTNAQRYSQVEAERTQLELIIQQSSAPMLVVDEDGRLVRCNAAAAPLLDCAAGSSPVGQPLAALTDNRTLLDVFDFLKDGHLSGCEVQAADGRVFSATVSPIEGVGYAVLLHDISHLKEANRAKTELVEMVSHQVRSPLTAILSYIELLRRTGNLNEQQMAFAVQVQDGVKQITQMLDDLLSLSRIEAGLERTHVETSLATAARHAVNMLQSHATLKNQQLLLDVTTPLPLVAGNPVQLQQMFVNLVDNAIKYTPEGGQVRVSLFPQGGEVVAQVTDTGMGVPAEEQPFVFERFYRARNAAAGYEGTGLGLSIVRSIVEAHGGRIWMESSPGEGTTFTVILPACGGFDAGELDRVGEEGM